MHILIDFTVGNLKLVLASLLTPIFISDILFADAVLLKENK